MHTECLYECLYWQLLLIYCAGVLLQIQPILKVKVKVNNLKWKENFTIHYYAVNTLL